MQPRVGGATPGASGGSSRDEHRPLPPVAGYVLAVAVPLLVTLTVWAADNPDFRLGTAFIAAVAMVAALAGTRAALVSTAVGFVGFWYAVVPPPSSFRLLWPDGLIALATYVVCCAVVVLIVHQRDRAAARMAEFRRRDQRLSEQGLIGTFSWQLDGPITGANDAFLAMLGYTRADLEQGRLDWTERTPPEYRAEDATKVQALLDVGFHEPYEKEYVRQDGTRVPVLLGSSLLEGSTRDGVSFVLDVSERWRLEEEREALLEAEQTARRDAEAATRLLQVVADASESVMEAFDPEEVVRRLADAVVPELADVASVFVPEGDLLRRAVTVDHRHPELAAILNTRFPVTVRSGAASAEAFRLGRTLPVPDANAKVTVPASHDDEYMRAVRAMNLTSGWVIPLKAGGEVLGVLSLSGTVERGPVDETSLLVAEQIADRAAIALQKAQTIAAERRVASLMQQALLPDGPQTIDGHEVGTCYVPAAVGREIGGDWWDVLPLPDGRVALVVGDVSGHGVHVAPSMAKLRHSIDGVLTHGAEPVDAVTAASVLLESNGPGNYASAFVSIYDPVTRELVYSRAGHPPPLVVVEDDVVHLDHPGGTLLGINVGSRSQDRVTLPDDFELVAFTDGLVEEPGLSYDAGVERLVDAVRALPPRVSGQRRAERLVAGVVGTAGRDDVCVVMVRPSPRGNGSAA